MRFFEFTSRLTLVLAIAMSLLVPGNVSADSIHESNWPNENRPHFSTLLQQIPFGPPGTCDSKGFEVVNLGMADALDTRVCNGKDPDTADIWLISSSTVGRIVQITSSKTQHTVPVAKSMIWGPDYWFLVLDDYPMSPGESFRVEAQRYGFNASDRVTAVQLDLTLINEMIYVGDTPKPYMTSQEYYERYGRRILDETVSILSSWGDLFVQASNTELALELQKCTAEITGYHYDNDALVQDMVDCVMGLSTSTLGADFLKGLFGKARDLAPILSAYFSTIKISWVLALMTGEMGDKNRDAIVFVNYTGSPDSQPHVPSVCDPCIDNAQQISDLLDTANLAYLPDRNITKLLRVRNTGTSSWNSYRLVFFGGEQMGGPSTQIILPTAPGEETSISLGLRTPATGGLHTGSWQIVNPDGVVVPGGNLAVRINVVSPSTPYENARISAFSADPSSPSGASQVLLHARVNWWSGYRAMRVKDGNTVIGEISATDHTFSWDTGAVSRGDHTLTLEVDDQTGNPWDNPERQTLIYTLQGSPMPSNHAPNRPIADSPYDWQVFYSGNTARLCAQTTGDPDGNAVTGFYFDIYESAQLWNSGWVTSSCVTTEALGPFTYKWRVKVRDNQGAVSEWSDSSHFSLVDQTLTISEFYFQPQDAQSEVVKIRACTSGLGGINVTLRVSVNDASDGSDKGQWHVIKELGVPCFSDLDAPIWNTLSYGDGPHLVRVEARGNTSNWSGATIQNQVYALPHRRPDAAQLQAPVHASQNWNEAVFLNSRTVTFRWSPGARATGQTLHIGTTPDPKDSPSPVFRQSLERNITSVTVTFADDFPQIFWQITSSNDKGMTPSVYPSFGIDRTPPSCGVESLSNTSYESVFKVSWLGTDNLSGPKSYDIQVMDRIDSVWRDWLLDTPMSKTFDLFMGQSGHTYAFRCRTTDLAGNLGDYPTGADTSILIDVNTRPITPWWNLAYTGKRNIAVQNNMPNASIPVGYPIRLHFDNATNPTAAQLYASSQSNPKCNDLRVIHNDASELDRLILACSADEIKIWFKSPVKISQASADITSIQLYLGNPGAATPPSNPLNVWPGGNTGDIRAYISMQDGTGTTARDLTTWGNHCNFDSSAIHWVSNSKFGAWSLDLPNPPDGGGLACGSNGVSVSPFSAELYLYYEGDGWIMSNLSNYAESERWIWSIVGQKPTIQVYVGGGGSSLTQDTPLTKNTWNHLAVTFDGNRTIRFYQNGQLRKVGELNLAGIRTPNVPLYVGGAQTNSRVRGKISFAKLTSGLLDSFPHGAFATVTTEPTTGVGSVVAPPTAGRPDLAVESINIYPNPEGGIYVRAKVDNLGNESTGNGFLSHIFYDGGQLASAVNVAPLTGWTALPISNSAGITLTSIIQPDDVLGTAPTTPMQEISGTLTLVVDSAGVVAEVSKVNNSAISEVCIAVADEYETDNQLSAAHTLTPGTTENHNFHTVADRDWLQIDATTGSTYTIETTNLGSAADTILTLRAPDGTILFANDDYGNSLASRVEFKPDVTGTYYIEVRQWNPNVSGCGTNYGIRVIRASVPNTSCMAEMGKFCATYYNNQTLSDVPIYSEIVTSIDFNWAANNPATGVNADNFSVRWEGVFGFDAGTYRFTARTNDGMRAWIDDTLVLNEWRNQQTTDYEVLVDVTAGQHTVKVEYFDNDSDALARFSWSIINQPVCSPQNNEYCSKMFIPLIGK